MGSGREGRMLSNRDTRVDGMRHMVVNQKPLGGGGGVTMLSSPNIHPSPSGSSVS